METAPEPITVLAVGGTGESYPGDARTHVTGMLAAVTDRLDDRFAARWVGYPASYGPTAGRHGLAYVDSVAFGVGRLASAIRETDGPVMLIGYSQGAAVIRTLLSHPSAARLVDQVASVGFVADPNQPPGVIDGCLGWGVAGPGAPLPGDVPACWVGAADDMICNATEDSLIRDIADLTDSLSVSHVRRWMSAMRGAVLSDRMQNAARTSVSPSQWRRDLHRLGNAARELRGYLPPQIRIGSRPILNRGGGRHVSYAEEPYRHAPLTDPDTTGCEYLAEWMQVQVTMGERLESHNSGERRLQPAS
ncbi:PE-PPE domain-containing protein [Gordonia zhaorongruii]|uniref:PE-PPE domain-containing protein n=1 Tax=Gordonia zhaorongruii TaxID=2597659 RepID=UPI001180039E|nr:PE-PPE domain-containing protein [Gordonia zhaorongruii]